MRSEQDVLASFFTNRHFHATKTLPLSSPISHRDSYDTPLHALYILTWARGAIRALLPDQWQYHGPLSVMHHDNQSHHDTTVEYKMWPYRLPNKRHYHNWAIFNLSPPLQQLDIPSRISHRFNRLSLPFSRK